MAKICPYCQRSNVKFSREHIISRSVLHEVFGTPIRNVVSGELAGGRRIQDQEPVSKHVCRECNSKLSPYDQDAVALTREIFAHPNLIGKTITLTVNRLNWLTKTHLNYLAITKSKLTNKLYPISPDIYSVLLSGGPVPVNLYCLCVDTIEAEPGQWDPSNAQWFGYYHYRSVEFRAQRVIVSDLRMKSFESFLIFPSDQDYYMFAGRVSSALNEMKTEVRIEPQKVDLQTLVANPTIVITHYVTKQHLNFLMEMEDRTRHLS